MLGFLVKRLLALAACVTLFGAAIGQAPPGRDTERDRELLEKVGRLLRWQAYWEGPGALRQSYRAGQVVQMRIVRSVQDITVFIAAAGLKASFPLATDGTLLPPASSILAASETNETASSQYLHGLNVPGTSDCIPVRSKGPIPRDPAATSIPAARACVEPWIHSGVRQEDVPFTLPTLTPPEGVLRRSVPRDLDELRTLLVQSAQTLGLTRCDPAVATIPYMFEEDPLLYVLIQWCGNRGVQIVARDHRGRWELSKFLVSSIDDVPRLADLISRTAATRLALK